MKVIVEFIDCDENFDKVVEYENIKNIVHIDDEIMLVQNSDNDYDVLEVQEIKNVICKFGEEMKNEKNI